MNHTCTGAVTLSPSAISTCLQNLIVLRCTISGTLLTWTVAVPGNTAQMLSLSSTQILAVQTIRVNNDVFLIERISSDPFEVHMSVNASSALNGTLINCDDSSNNVEDTEMTTISIAGM